MTEWRTQERALQSAADSLNLPVSENHALTAQRTLELANQAHFLYVTRNHAEQGQLLKMVLLNCATDGGSIAGLTQVSYRGSPKWHVIEPGRAGPPSPNSVRPNHPEHVVAIFIQAIYSVTEGAVRSIAVNICSIDRAELSRRRQRVTADPNRCVAILKNRRNDQASKVRVPSELAISPARQASRCADPESAVAGDMEPHDRTAGKRFAIYRRLPLPRISMARSHMVSRQSAKPERY
jgi:hypothetical protein